MTMCTYNPLHPATDRRAISREILDPTGRSWSVNERVCGENHLGHPVLVFDCHEMVRVVRSYPADWAVLSDLALLAHAERF